VLTTSRRSSAKKQEGPYSQGMEKEHALYFMIKFRNLEVGKQAAVLQTVMIAPASLPESKRQY